MVTYLVYFYFIPLIMTNMQVTLYDGTISYRRNNIRSRLQLEKLRVIKYYDKLQTIKIYTMHSDLDLRYMLFTKFCCIKYFCPENVLVFFNLELQQF